VRTLLAPDRGEDNQLQDIDLAGGAVVSQKLSYIIPAVMN
jgi:hypothetical protein